MSVIESSMKEIIDKHDHSQINATYKRVCYANKKFIDINNGVDVQEDEDY